MPSPRPGSRSSSSPARHLAAFDAVCDVLVERLAAERLVLPGYGHTAQRHPDSTSALAEFVGGPRSLSDRLKPVAG